MVAAVTLGYARFLAGASSCLVLSLSKLSVAVARVYLLLYSVILSHLFGVPLCALQVASYGLTMPMNTMNRAGLHQTKVWMWR